MESFSVRCLFLWQCASENARHVYEEGITLWQADNFEQAIEMAVNEAVTYASENDHQFLGFSQTYYLVDPVPVSGVEVFSLLRESDFAAEDYINAFFSTGTEREG